MYYPKSQIIQNVSAFISSAHFKAIGETGPVRKAELYETRWTHDEADIFHGTSWRVIGCQLAMTSSTSAASANVTS